MDQLTIMAHAGSSLCISLIVWIQSDAWGRERNELLSCVINGVLALSGVLLLNSVVGVCCQQAAVGMGGWDEEMPWV